MDQNKCARFPVKDYDLAATLQSGQAFRWTWSRGGWEGIIDRRWVQLNLTEEGIEALTAEPNDDWRWLKHYLQTDVDLSSILATFPQDEPLRASTAACRGLRLLRQDPWECLATFILSSSKRIIQIRQIVALLCERFGEAVTVPPGHSTAFSFPSPQRLAVLSEEDLRACKMGYRAPGLLETSRCIANGDLCLQTLAALTMEEAREQLLRLRGVGPKIAHCVLLFAYGFPTAFPVDVWVLKALRELYFPKRKPRPRRLERFVATYFGPHAGYAQQYLFHYMRTQGNIPKT